MIKPSFRLDDIKEEGNIEPKVLAEYKVKPRYAEKGDRTFCIPEMFCSCQATQECVVEEKCSDYEPCRHFGCHHDECGCEYTV